MLFKTAHLEHTRPSFEYCNYSMIPNDYFWVISLFLSTGMLISNYSSLIWFIVTGYTTPAPSSFPQGNEGELSPHSRLQPPGGYSSFGAGSDDPALVDKKKAAQQAYQEELKRQVFYLWNCFVQSGLEMKWEMLWLRVLNSGSWKPWVNICLF